MNDFQPRYLAISEFAAYGLPDAEAQPDIVTLVERASTMIDESCGRVDTDGNGSLVYTTYTERLLLPGGRNIFRLSFRPLIGVTVDTVNNLAASGCNGSQPNNYYTGVQPNTLQATAGLSPLISASGRYGYARRSSQQVYPDLNYAANVLQIASFFGGPPQWTPIDVTMIDFDPRTGELWVPAGLYLSQYTEVVVTYNSGFDPLHMPRTVKHVCASMVKNMLPRAAATGLKSFGMGKVNAQFDEMVIDQNLDTMLQPFRTVRSA